MRSRRLVVLENSIFGRSHKAPKGVRLTKSNIPTVGKKLGTIRTLKNFTKEMKFNCGRCNEPIIIPIKDPYATKEFTGVQCTKCFTIHNIKYEKIEKTKGDEDADHVA